MSEKDNVFNFNFNTNCFNTSNARQDYDCPQSCLFGDSTSTYNHTLGSSFQPGPLRSPKRRGRPIANNAARERTRVKTLRSAFLDLQRTLPAVPPDTKLSKLDVLVLATTYIAHLMSTLADDKDISQVFAANGCMHPVKKWPMRTRLYAGILSSTLPQPTPTSTRNTTFDWYNTDEDLN